MKDGLWAYLNNWTPTNKRYRLRWANEDTTAEVEGLDGVDIEIYMREWANCHAFLALLMARPDLPDYEEYGMITIQSSLEKIKVTTHEHGLEVPAATVLVFFASELL